jgi:hypothetical protein
VIHNYERDSIPDFEEYQDCFLIKELKSRGYDVFAEVCPLAEKIYHLRRCGHDYQRELDKLLDAMVGRY